MSVVAVGSEMIVNTVIGGNQYRPFLTSLANGGYMIGWQDASGEGSPPGDISDDVRYAVYDAFGTRVSGAGDLIANTEKKGAQFEGAGSGFSDGKYVMVWTDASQTSPDFNNRAVRGQIFNADGSKSGSPFIVNQSFELSQTEPSVAVLSNGKFVVTWTNEDVDASGAKQILARLFEANGTPAGDEFLINTQQDVGDEIHSTVIGLSGGGFAVVWNDREDSNATSNQTATYVRLYNNAGSALGPAKVANSNAGDPQNISVTEMIDGRLLLVWSDEVFTSPPGDGSGASIRARFLDRHLQRQVQCEHQHAQRPDGPAGRGAQGRAVRRGVDGPQQGGRGYELHGRAHAGVRRGGDQGRQRDAGQHRNDVRTGEPGRHGARRWTLRGCLAGQQPHRHRQ
jgi:hypothetical protein